MAFVLRLVSTQRFHLRQRRLYCAGMELCDSSKLRKLFLRDIIRRRHEGQLSLMSGPVVDKILVQELDQPHTDMRCGVNIICRPTIEVVKYIVSIQEYLSRFEPDQYYYPPSDLHLTLVEICHSRPPEDASFIAGVVASEIRRIAAMTSLPKVDSPMLAFDSHAVALNLLPTDDALQSARQFILEELSNLGISMDSRYETKSAHVTLMRYITPLRTASEEWIGNLTNFPMSPGLVWSLSPVWLTWGANWYGMRSRIEEIGPIHLGT
jgi:2'-5' RNA ligase